jgi:hypothetical protein
MNSLIRKGSFPKLDTPLDVRSSMLFYSIISGDVSSGIESEVYFFFNLLELLTFDGSSGKSAFSYSSTIDLSADLEWLIAAYYWRALSTNLSLSASFDAIFSKIQEFALF